MELRPWKTYNSQILHVDLLQFVLEVSRWALPPPDKFPLPTTFLLCHKVLCAGNTVVSWAKCRLHQWCGLRPSVLGQDQSVSQEFILTEARSLMASAGARAYNGGLGAEPPAGSRDRAPGQGVRGRSPPWSWTPLSFAAPIGRRKFGPACGISR